MQPLMFPAINRSEEESRKNGINPGTEEDRIRTFFKKKKKVGEKCVRKETEKCAPTVHDFPNYLPSEFYYFLYCSFYFIKSSKATVSNFAANEIMQASFHKEQLFF